MKILGKFFLSIIVLYGVALQLSFAKDRLWSGTLIYPGGDKIYYYDIKGDIKFDGAHFAGKITRIDKQDGTISKIIIDGSLAGSNPDSNNLSFERKISAEVRRESQKKGMGEVYRGKYFKNYYESTGSMYDERGGEIITLYDGRGYIVLFKEQ